ncbi:hypothetical protein [Celeribacter marinus]|uniref:hypothetical protein n=1 Tax=Celeribacter marinus TaxID=1397108 RepID=UPI003170081D
MTMHFGLQCCALCLLIASPTLGFADEAKPSTDTTTVTVANILDLKDISGSAKAKQTNSSSIGAVAALALNGGKEHTIAMAAANISSISQVKNAGSVTLSQSSQASIGATYIGQSFPNQTQDVNAVAFAFANSVSVNSVKKKATISSTAQTSATISANADLSASLSRGARDITSVAIGNMFSTDRNRSLSTAANQMTDGAQISATLTQGASTISGSDIDATVAMFANIATQTNFRGRKTNIKQSVTSSSLAADLYLAAKTTGHIGVSVAASGNMARVETASLSSSQTRFDQVATPSLNGIKTITARAKIESDRSGRFDVTVVAIGNSASVRLAGGVGTPDTIDTTQTNNYGITSSASLKSTSTKRKKVAAFAAGNAIMID